MTLNERLLAAAESRNIPVTRWVRLLVLSLSEVAIEGYMRAARDILDELES